MCEDVTIDVIILLILCACVAIVVYLIFYDWLSDYLSNVTYQDRRIIRTRRFIQHKRSVFPMVDRNGVRIESDRRKPVPRRNVER